MALAARLFEQLGYEFSADTARRTIEYYDRRCSQGSTLSLIVYAGGPHGITDTHKDRLNADLLEFLRR